METRTAGSASGLGKRTGSNPDTTLKADSTDVDFAAGKTRPAVRAEPGIVASSRARLADADV